MYSTMGDMSRQFGKNVSTLKRWRAKGLIPEPAYTSSYGWHLWSPEQVQEILRSIRSGRPSPKE